MIDRLKVDQGMYDEIYIDLDKNITDENVRPTSWTPTTIMDSRFNGDLDGGSIGAEGFKITGIQLQRTLLGSGKWDVIGTYDYTPDFNFYDYIDRFTQNGAIYQYAVVPVANDVSGNRMISDEVQSSFEGIFITDKKENRRLQYDITLGDISYNTVSSVNQPINGKFPVVTFGNSKYRSGNLTVLPLSKQTVALAGSGIDKFAEQATRMKWLEFLENGRAKVIRMDNGVLMLVVTHSAIVTHRDGDILRDLADISFEYVEVGDINFDTLLKNDLVNSSVYMKKVTFDDYGGIING